MPRSCIRWGPAERSKLGAVQNMPVGRITVQQLVVRAGRRISAWLQPGNRRYFPVFLFGLSIASSSLVALAYPSGRALDS